MDMNEKILQRYEKTEPDDLPEPAPNCWFCTECNATFDKPLRLYRHSKIGRMEYPLRECCPNCHSEDIEECYDEQLAEARREQYDMRGRY